MKTEKTNRLWVVVWVQSGVPVQAEVFADKLLAEKCEMRLRSKRRVDYDEVGLFEAKVKSVLE